MEFAPDVVAGELIYLETCGRGSCHGPDGRLGPAPNLTGGLAQYDDERLAEVIRNGRPGVGMSSGMPGQELTEQEIADVIAFVRLDFPSE